MNNNNFVKNAEGFGLVGALIAMGISSMILLGIMEMLAYSASAQRGIQIKANETSFKGSLTNVLLQDPTCTNALRGNHITESLNIYDPANPTVSLVKSGMNFREWDVSALQLTNQQLIDSAMSLYSANVVITLSHSVKIVGLLPSVTSQLATVYYTAPSGVISRCFGGTNIALAAKNYCSTMGGTWSDSAVQCTLPTVAAASLASEATPNTTVLSATEMSTPPADTVAISASSATAVSTTPVVTPSTTFTAGVTASSGHSNSNCDDNHGAAGSHGQNGLTVLEVTTLATGTINMAVANSPAALVVTGVTHSVGNGKK